MVLFNSRRRSGGIDGNERLTAAVGVLVLAPGLVESRTVLLRVQTVMSWHLFVGPALVPVVRVKLVSHRRRLARQRGLVDLERRRVGQPGVRRDAFAGRDELTIHLAGPGVGPERVGRGSVYLHVNDADALADEWRSAGVEIVEPGTSSGASMRALTKIPTGT